MCEVEVKTDFFSQADMQSTQHFYVKKKKKEKKTHPVPTATFVISQVTVHEWVRFLTLYFVLWSVRHPAS